MLVPPQMRSSAAIWPSAAKGHAWRKSAQWEVSEKSNTYDSRKCNPDVWKPRKLLIQEK